MLIIYTIISKRGLPYSNCCEVNILYTDENNHEQTLRPQSVSPKLSSNRRQHHLVKVL